MARLRLKYVHTFRDRHGKTRHYFRRKGFKDIALSGIPGSDEFMLAYQAALTGVTAPKIEIGAAKSPPGTISATIGAFYASAAFQGLAPSTQVTYRNVLERFRAEFGRAQVKHLEPVLIRKILEKRAKKPAAANSLLKRLRAVMQFALDADLIKVDPTIGVRPIRQRTSGFHSWTEAEIEQFIEFHKPGTKAHLALSLLLYTGQRRSDVVRMGRQHVRDGVLSIKQKKTGNSVDVPVHADLESAIAAVPADNLTYLRTAFGKPFDAAGFGNWFRARCNEASLPKECSSHGLRKAAARRLAEVGCTSHEIAAITGHQSLKEVERYTRAFDRKGAGERAMEKLKTGTQSRKP